MTGDVTENLLKRFVHELKVKKCWKSVALKKVKNELVEDALWLWFIQERRRGTPINGPILKEKALILHSKFQQGEAFVASEGWLSRWKKRHGVHFLGICGEKLSANPTAASDFSKKFEKIISDANLSPEQIYNVDETGLNFKMLPRKTFATARETSAPGFKINKERIKRFRDPQDTLVHH